MAPVALPVVSWSWVGVFLKTHWSSLVHHVLSRPASRESDTVTGIAICTPPGSKLPVCCAVTGPWQTPRPPSTQVWFRRQVLFSEHGAPAFGPPLQTLLTQAGQGFRCGERSCPRHASPSRQLPPT